MWYSLVMFVVLQFGRLIVHLNLLFALVCSQDLVVLLEEGHQAHEQRLLAEDTIIIVYNSIMI